jgi:hypothetical protein
MAREDGVKKEDVGKLREDVRGLLYALVTLITFNSFLYSVGWVDYQKDTWDTVMACLSIFSGFTTLIILKVAT